MADEILEDDEWNLMIFDVNAGEHNDPVHELLSRAFRECSVSALAFVVEHPEMQMRVVIERIM